MNWAAFWEILFRIWVLCFVAKRQEVEWGSTRINCLIKICLRIIKQYDEQTMYRIHARSRSFHSTPSYSISGLFAHSVNLFSLRGQQSTILIISVWSNDPRNLWNLKITLYISNWLSELVDGMFSRISLTNYYKNQWKNLHSNSFFSVNI